MANQLKASWGVKTVTGTVSTASGVVSDFERSVEPVAAPLSSETGSDIGHTIYDKKYSFSATVMCKNTTALPDVGTIITIKGQKYYVERASITENNQSYTKFAISGSGYETMKIDTDITS